MHPIKAQLMDEIQMSRSIKRIAHEILEHNKGTADLCLIGIRRRGLPLAGRIRDAIREIEGVEIPVGEIDISLYRDDLTAIAEEPRLKQSPLPFDVRGKKIILADDVIYTGRTVRAAIEAVFAHGRPAEIALAVLVDRGHRELPIRPDFVGKNVPTSKKELVAVSFAETDGENCVRIESLE